MYYNRLKKVNSLLFFGFAILALLHYGAEFLIPITFAAFLAALVNPVYTLLAEKKYPGKIPAALISTIIVFIVVGGISYMLFYQLGIFAEDLPQLKEEFKSFKTDMQEQLSAISGISIKEQQQFISERSDQMLTKLEQELTLLLGNLLTVTLKFLLVLIYLFLFLLYKQRFVKMVHLFSASGPNSRSKELMEKGSQVIFHYLWGRFKVMLILAALYIVTFWYFNIPYAALLTIFGAIITIIPYIGPFISGTLPVLLVIVLGRDFSDVLIFASVVLVIQLIESYVLEPVIIGSEVELSPLAVIVAILIGGMVWGIAGMILFVPLLAIVKIAVELSPKLKPLAMVLGNGKK